MMLYVITFIMGGLISLILYGKVPIIISLAISTMVGGVIGYVYNKIKQKKAEQDYVKWLQYMENLTNQRTGS